MSSSTLATGAVAPPFVVREDKDKVQSDCILTAITRSDALSFLPVTRFI